MTRTKSTKKSTKRALLMSALSLLLCVSMLIGSTFAWFTDTVTSARNQIVSGNLDIKLYYSTWNGAAWTDYAEVDSNTKVFNDGALYEPGYTEVVKFKVENAGSLALKYNMTAMVYSEEAGINVENKSFKLSEHIYVGMINNVADTLDRDTAAAAATSKLSTGFGLMGNQTLRSGQTDEFALVLSMPTTVGNEANHLEGHQPSIEFGVALVATQYIAESDDFGNNYDENATYPVNIAVSKDVTRDANNKVASSVTITYEDESAAISDVKVVVPEGTLLGADTTQLILKIEEQDEANARVMIKSSQTATTYEITLEGVAQNNDKPISVTLVIEKGLTDVELWHNDVKINSTYNAATGELNFETTGFSPFTVVHKKVEGEIYDADELKAAFEKGGNYSLAADIALDADETITLAADKTLLLDLNGYTISAVSDVADKNEDGKCTSADNIIVMDVRGNLTVKNGTMTIEHKGTDMEWNAQHEIFYVGFNGALTLDNLKLENLGGTAMAYCVDLVNATNIILNVNNCELKSTYIPVRVFNNGSGLNNVTIKNSTVHGENRALWVHIYTNKDNGGKGIKDSTLNFDIFNGTNKFSATKSSETPICYGFTNAYRYDANGNFAYVEVETADGLAEAISNGYDVVLIENITLNDSPLTITNNVVIDTNGKTISGIATNASASAMITVKPGATLTLTGDGVITFGATTPDTNWGGEGQPAYPGYANNTIRCEGKLVVDGVTINNVTKPGGASYAIDCYQGSDLIVNSGTIDGVGKLAIRMFCNSNTVSTNVTINGGTITGKRAVWVQLPGSNIANVRPVNLTINGGDLICTNTDADVCVYSYSYGDSFANTNITITGGTFTGDVCFGGGNAKTTQENVTITGGTFNGELGRYLADDGWEEIAKPQ